MTEVTKEQVDSLRELAETLSGKKLGNIKDPAKLQAIIDVSRAEEDEKADSVKSKAASDNEKRKANKVEAFRLRRVIVRPVAPFNKQLPSEFISAGNRFGYASRVVAFNKPWHVEQIILNVLADKKYRAKVERTDPTTRRKVYSNDFLPAFSIEYLDDLTPQELKELADDQRARHAIDD